jgi:hypothetical protein
MNSSEAPNPTKAASSRRGLKRRRGGALQKESDDVYNPTGRMRNAAPQLGGQSQELKKKHGIDYDSHASYRFIEE